MEERSLEVLPEHSKLWAQIAPMVKSQNVAQAMLFTGPKHANLSQFANRLAAMLLCSEQSKPCGHCKACLLISADTHPDSCFIVPDKEGSVIKVEQIRMIQQNGYQTPKIGDARVVVISPADKMNLASANALLKLLEEPPSFLHFILLVEQLSTVPATILSRCQKYVCPGDLQYLSRYPELGKQYPEASPRAQLYQDHSQFMELFCDVIEGKTSPCTAASQWSAHSLDDFLWYLYLVVAQTIRMQLTDVDDQTTIASDFKRFSGLTNPINLFALLAKINTIRGMIIRNISINQTLVIEDLLISGFCRDNL